MNELTVPINWMPEWVEPLLWPGRCDGTKDGEPCGTQSLNIMCLVDDETHLIEEYDMSWVECSWCQKRYRLKGSNGVQF